MHVARRDLRLEAGTQSVGSDRCQMLTHSVLPESLSFLPRRSRLAIAPKMDIIRSLAMHLYDRILALVKGASPGTIQLSGILGLVIAIIGYYHLKGNNNATDGPDRRAAQGGQQQRGGAVSTTPTGGEPSSSNSRPHAQPGSAPSNPSSSSRPAVPAAAARSSAAARAVAARLHGVRRVTISCQGVLLQPGALSDSATLWPGVAELVQVGVGEWTRVSPCGLKYRIRVASGASECH